MLILAATESASIVQRCGSVSHAAPQIDYGSLAGHNNTVGGAIITRGEPRANGDRGS
jgi:hypothetical protein